MAVDVFWEPAWAGTLFSLSFVGVIFVFFGSEFAYKEAIRQREYAYEILRLSSLLNEALQTPRGDSREESA